MSDKMRKAADAMRAFLYDEVYTKPEITQYEKRAEEVLCGLFDYLKKRMEIVYKEFPFLETEEPERAICDYIATLNDREAQEMFEEAVQHA